MTRTELVAQYGRPVRSERSSDGGEIWYYNFGTQTRAETPISESTVGETERSFTVGHSTSTTTTMTERPLHLSPDGHVIAPVPIGNVVVN